MNCATHHAPALGVCRACGAGLCAECRATDVFGFVCADGPCVARARAMDRILGHSGQTVAAAQKGFRAGGCGSVLGAAFAFAGVWWVWDADQPVLFWTFAAAGVVLGVMGVTMLLTKFPGDDGGEVFVASDTDRRRDA